MIASIGSEAGKTDGGPAVNGSYPFTSAKSLLYGGRSSLSANGARASDREAVPCHVRSQSRVTLPSKAILRRAAISGLLLSVSRSEEHTSELQSPLQLGFRLLL